MTRGGKRAGSGRRAILTEDQQDRVGQACERVWYFLSIRRPYGIRRDVLFAAAVIYSVEFSCWVTKRRVEAAWKLCRRKDLGRAQRGQSAFVDAERIEDLIFDRLERLHASVEILSDDIDLTEFPTAF